MSRRKYIYHYMIDNKEVSKEEFMNRLSQHFLKCDTNYENPLLNISYVDEKELNKVFRRIKNGVSYIFWGDIDICGYFKINKEVI